MPEAILFSQMEPAPEWEAEFNDWYDHEHVPVRLALPGFVGASRYVVVQGSPKYAAVYYLTGLHVLESPAYQVLKQEPDERTARMLASVRGFTRYVGQELSRFTQPDATPDATAAPFLYMVLFAVPTDRETEFNRWYDDEHCPMLLRNGHWCHIRRYRIRAATPRERTHLALHYLGDLSALDSEEREEARHTPWRTRLASEAWFHPEHAVYTRLPPAWQTARAVPR